jgi:hypothetical protein
VLEKERTTGLEPVFRAGGAGSARFREPKAGWQLKPSADPADPWLGPRLEYPAEHEYERERPTDLLLGHREGTGGAGERLRAEDGASAYAPDLQEHPVGAAGLEPATSAL